MLDGYTKYRNHTIDHTKIDSDLVDFPVLVKLTVSNFDFSGCRTDGKDNRFTQADDTLLKHEVERFDNANEKAEFFVKIPAVSSAGDTVIKHQYDKADEASDGADPENVWDANAKMVQHMNQDPSGSAPQMIDSTINSNDGTSNNMDSGDLVEGKIGKCLDFDGVNDYVDCGSDESLDITSPMTIEGWFYTSNITTKTGLVRKGDSYWMGVEDYKLFFSQASGDWDLVFSGTNLTSNQWTHFVITHDNADLISAYINGQISGTPGTLSLNSDAASSLDICGTASPFHFNGSIDEVRIYNRALSAAWTKANYNSGNDTLLSYGSEVAVTNWTNSENAYASDDNYAVNNNSERISDWKDFDFDIPSGSEINGILLKIEGHYDTSQSSPTCKVKLSWNGGDDWTTAKEWIPDITSDSQKNIGGIVDLWDRVWSPDEFSNANFRVKINGYNGYNSIDHIQAEIHHSSLIKTTSRNLNEIISIVDNVSIQKVLHKTLSEVITIVDTLANKTAKIFNETITVVDGITKSTGKVLSEVITIVDTIKKTTTRVFAETITIVDGLTNKATKVLSEVIAIADSVSITKALAKTLSEVVSITDTVQKKLVKTLSEVIAIVDTVQNKATKVLTETITIVDGIVKATSKVLTETISIVESIYIKLNGINVKWARKYSEKAGAFTRKYSEKAGTFIKKYWKDI